MGRRNDVETRVARGILQGLFALAVVAAALAMLPGTDEYQGGVLVETRPVAGAGFLVFEAIALVPLIFIYRKPSLGWLWIWSMLMWVGTIALIAATFHLDFGNWGRDVTYVYRPAHDAWPLVAWPLGIVVYVVLPAGMIVYWIVAKVIDVRMNRPPPPPEAPVARVVRR